MSNVKSGHLSLGHLNLSELHHQSAHVMNIWEHFNISSVFDNMELLLALSEYSNSMLSR